MKISLLRLIGIVGLVTSLLWVLGSLVGLFVGLGVIQSLNQGATDTLDETVQSLQIVSDSLSLSQGLIGDVSQDMAQAQIIIQDLSATISDTSSLLNDISQATAQDIPNGLERAQDKMPNVIGGFKEVNEVLSLPGRISVTLRLTEEVSARFPARLSLPESISLTLPLTEIEPTVNVDYSPNSPLYQPFEEIHQELQGIPSSLRQVGASLDALGEALSDAEQGFDSLADGWGRMNQHLSAVQSPLEDGIQVVADTQSGLEQTVSSFQTTLGRVKWWLAALCILICFAQILPVTISIVFVFGDPGREREPSLQDLSLSDYSDVFDLE